MPVMGLVAHWFKARSRGRAGGLLMMGNGFAIMLSGTLAPLLTASQGPAGWHYGWLLLGALVVTIALTAATLLRDNPEGIGLEPIGAEEHAGHPGSTVNEPPKARTPRLLLVQLAALFFIFCFTYVIYATFIVTTLVKEIGFSEAQASHLWIWIGFCALFSGPLFGGLADLSGSFSSSYLLAAGLTAVAAAIALLLPKPVSVSAPEMANDGQA